MHPLQCHPATYVVMQRRSAMGLWNTILGWFGGPAVATAEPALTQRPATGDTKRIMAALKEDAPALPNYQDGIIPSATPTPPAELSLVHEFEQLLIAHAIPLALPPASAMDVMAMVNDPYCQVQQLASAIGRDPALAGSILKLANSAMYRGGTQISDLHQAIVRLGQRQVKLLVFTVLFQSKLVRGAPYESISALAWKHSLFTARLALQLAKSVGGVESDHAYMAGLFHNIGVLGILSGAQQWLKKKNAALSPRAIVSLVQHHAHEYNAQLIEDWNLLPDVAAAVRSYRQYELAGAGSRVAATVWLANEIAKKHGLWVETRDVALENLRVLGFLQLSPDKLPKAEAIIAIAQEIAGGGE